MTYTNYREKKEIRKVFSQIRSDLMNAMKKHQEDREAELFCGDLQIETMEMNPGNRNNEIRLTFFFPIFAVSSSMKDNNITSDEIVEAIYDYLNNLWDNQSTNIQLNAMRISTYMQQECIELQSFSHKKTKTIDLKTINESKIKRCGTDNTDFCGIIEFDGIINMQSLYKFISVARALPMNVLKAFAFGEEFFYDIHPIINKVRADEEVVYTLKTSPRIFKTIKEFEIGDKGVDRNELKVDKKVSSYDNSSTQEFEEKMKDDKDGEVSFVDTTTLTDCFLNNDQEDIECDDINTEINIEIPEDEPQIANEEENDSDYIEIPIDDELDTDVKENDA